MSKELEIKSKLTVAEFIEILKQYPQDDIVVINGDCDRVEIYISEDYALGDCADPNCEYAEAVVIW